MKQRSTTPVFKTLTTKLLLVTAAFVVAVSAPLSMMQPAYADRFDSQISALQSQISQYQAKASELNKQAQTLEGQLAKLNNEKAQIQARIDLSQAKYNKLVSEIKANEKKIGENREALGDTIADLYVDDTISPLEMLASSTNIGDYVDRQSYRSSIQDSLSGTIAEIKILKKKLETQRTEVSRVLDDQKSQHKVLADKESERQAVLAATRGQKAAYDKLSSERQNQVNYLREQQRLAFAAINNGSSSSPTGYAINYKNWSGNVSCGGGYSYCGYGLDASVNDPWGLGLTAECVHYTADWLRRHNFYIPEGAFSPHTHPNGTYHAGNANQWIANATYHGFGRVVGTPAYGDVAYMAVPGVGHVGIVEANYGNGWVRVSQYNFATNGTAGYSTMDLQITSATQFLRFNQ
ncbi:MAG: CHAP domain-containing protein [Candidatus Saccharimonadales bacterium]